MHWKNWMELICTDAGSDCLRTRAENAERTVAVAADRDHDPGRAVVPVAANRDPGAGADDHALDPNLGPGPSRGPGPGLDPSLRNGTTAGHAVGLQTTTK